MSEPTQLERLTAARDRIAKAMGFQRLASGKYSELFTEDGAVLLVGVDQAEAIAGRLERRKVRVRVLQLDDGLWTFLIEDCPGAPITIRHAGHPYIELDDCKIAARRVAEQLGLEVVE